jgi:hypothetical protein
MWRLSQQAARVRTRCRRRAHRVVSAVRLPRLDGMVPLSALTPKFLHAAWGAQRPARAAHNRRGVTHRLVNALRLPRLDGIVPFSWLNSRSLHAGGDAVRLQRGRHSARGTHMFCSAVRLPRLDGMVPLSRLPEKLLRARMRGGPQRPAKAAQRRRHAQNNQCSQVAKAGRDGAEQLVVGEVPACRRAWRLSASSGGRSTAGVTHSCVSVVRLSRLDGMVPLSWLPLRFLRPCM